MYEVELSLTGRVALDSVLEEVYKHIEEVDQQHLPLVPNHKERDLLDSPETQPTTIFPPDHPPPNLKTENNASLVLHTRQTQCAHADQNNQSYQQISL